MPRPHHVQNLLPAGVDFVQTTEVIVVHCAVPPRGGCGGDDGGTDGGHRLPAPVSVLCGPDWLSVSVGEEPAVQLALGGRVDPSSSFAALSPEDGWGGQRLRDRSPSASSSQSSEASFALVPIQPESQMQVKLYLSKDPPGTWNGPIVGPLFALPSSDLPPDGIALNVALASPNTDWDCTYQTSSGSPSPLSGSIRQLPNPHTFTAMASSTELRSAIVEAFADLQAVRDEFTPPHHNPAPRPVRPRSSPRHSSRTIRPAKDSDSDAGGSQASETILAVRPPLAPLAPALVSPPSVELVFPDPLAELGLAEPAVEGDVSSCSFESCSSSKRGYHGRLSRTSTARPLRRSRRPSSEATSTSASASDRFHSHRRKHRRHRIPVSRMSNQSVNTSFGIGIGVVAVSAMVLFWWRRTVRTP